MLSLSISHNTSLPVANCKEREEISVRNCLVDLTGIFVFKRPRNPSTARRHVESPVIRLDGSSSQDTQWRRQRTLSRLWSPQVRWDTYRWKKRVLIWMRCSCQNRIPRQRCGDISSALVVIENGLLLPAGQ